MRKDSFFCHISSNTMAEMIEGSKGPICYSAPGIQQQVAKAMVKASKHLGCELLSVWIDFDERVMRMGYGDIDSIKMLGEAGITVNHAAGLRSALIIADDKGYAFTPTPLYLEAEPGEDIRNALRLTKDQISEALARLSPSAKVVAVAMADTPEEKQIILDLPEEPDSVPVTPQLIETVNHKLEIAPPVKFDIVRQVRVFEPYLQYVELSMTGAAIQRQRLTIPPSIQKIGESSELEGRLRTTFDLIEKKGTLSSKTLEKELNEIRNNLTPSLGKKFGGRAVLKGSKHHLVKKLEEFRKKLDKHQKTVAEQLQSTLDDSKNQIIDYYIERVVESPPDALLGQCSGAKPNKEEARQWLQNELNRIFPEAESLINKMTLTERYKDVTYETLNQEGFMEALKQAFPLKNWEKAYNEFRAAGEHENQH